MLNLQSLQWPCDLNRLRNNNSIILEIVIDESERSSYSLMVGIVLNIGWDKVLISLCICIIFLKGK